MGVGGQHLETPSIRLFEEPLSRREKPAGVDQGAYHEAMGYDGQAQPQPLPVLGGGLRRCKRPASASLYSVEVSAGLPRPARPWRFEPLHCRRHTACFVVGLERRPRGRSPRLLSPVLPCWMSPRTCAELLAGLDMVAPFRFALNRLSDICSLLLRGVGADVIVAFRYGDAKRSGRNVASIGCSAPVAIS